ncbi:MAG: hypothetical protein HFH05_04910 [Lachnospiraceae bacterium]|nr:hypothetical protein [Lachnospiraceae bacterium]
MYVAGGIVLTCYLVLGFLSRREPAEGDVSRILVPFYKMAVCFYKKICIRKSSLFSSGQVERDLSVLYPGERKEQLKADYYMKKISFSLAIIFVGTLLGILARYNVQSNLILDKDGRIIRGNYKEGCVKIRLEAKCGDRNNGSFPIEVAPLQLADDEAEILWEEFWNRLPEYILGENEAFDRISSDLILEESYGDYPFLLEWESHSPAVVGSTGKVYGTEYPVEAEMTVKMIYGETVREKMLHLRVVPEELTAEERFREDLEKLLMQSEYESRGEDVWTLPDEWQGEAVNWQQETEDYSVALWVLAIVTALSVYRMFDYDLHRQLEQRKKRMWRDYPDIVHKLALYIGAGITIRGAFQKTAAEYEGRGENFYSAHPAYEEMLYACREMHSGVSEASVYEHFGKRTGLQEYIRLSTLLIQNLKKGNRALLERLREEADRAGEERLQSCKRLGEEAGTKLLVPMVLMLAVVMVMIMVPAFSAM